MCGIGGILRVTPPGEVHEPIPDSWVDALDAGIAWRGRDGSGRFRDRVTRADGTVVEVALVHRRLAIIDIEGGAQPMVLHAGECPACAAKLSERAKRDAGDARLAVVFNGCIYNHRELRKELEADGHVFGTDHSDTEVILHLAGDRIGDWTEWMEDPDAESGGEPLQRVEGMYSFLLWDPSIGRVYFARDSHGEKPLWWWRGEDDREQAWASSAAALERVARCMTGASAGLPRRRLVDSAALGFGRSGLSDFVAGSKPGEIGEVLIPWLASLEPPPRPARDRSLRARITTVWSWIAGILMVLFLIAMFLMGTYQIVRLMLWIGGLLVSTGFIWIALKLPVPWVVAKGIRAARKRPPASAESQTEFEQLLELSVAQRLEADVPLGCFLSGGVDSSLVALMASRHVPGLTTLTVRMPHEGYDESRFAEVVAERLGTRHLTLECDGSSAAEDLIALIRAMGTPFGDSSILPTWWLCRGARQHIKVALAGDGGDELFYGYDRYRASRYLWWPKRWAVAMLPMSNLDRSDPKSLDDRKARLITAARHGGYLDLLALFPTPDRRRLLGRAKGDIVGRQRPGASAAAMRGFDLECYLPGDLLRKVDTASMLAGVEVRLPFLDSELASAAMRVSARDHMARGEGKHILKQIARKHLPAEVIDRPKMGFAIPISDWWRTDFGGLGTLMMEKLSKEKPFGRVHEVLGIDVGFVREMIDEHRTAGGMAPVFTTRAVRARDHGQRLFSLVSLAIWAEQVG